LHLIDEFASGEGALVVRIVDWRGQQIYKCRLPSVREQKIRLSVKSGFDYFATVHALDASGNAARMAQLHFGVANAPRPERPLPEMPDLDKLLKGRNEPHVEYWTRQQTSQEYPWLSNVDLDDMRLWAEQVKEYGWNTLAVRTIWPDLELLPGVTRWDLIDEIMAIARDNGQKVMLGASVWGDRGEAVWMNWKPARDQYGDFPERLNLASIHDTASHTGKTDFWKNLARHYRNDQDMLGYHIVGSDYRVSVSPEARRLDYAEPMQAAFADWLETRNRTTHRLARLLSFPLVRIDNLGPDLSASWRETVEFFVDSNAATIETYLQAIRDLDSRRPILVDRKPVPWVIERAVPILATDANAALKNEGSPRFGDVALRSMSVQAGVPYLGELHRHVPTSQSLADVIYFWESLWADHAFWIQRWRGSQMQDWQNSKSNLRKDVPQVLAFMKRTQPNWNAYMELPSEEPEVLVFGSRAAELLGGRRRGYFDDIAGIEEYSALFRIHQVPVHFADEYTTWIDPQKFKLVFACGSIITSDAATRITAYADQGGKLVLVGEPGKHLVPPGDKTSDARWRQLGQLDNVRYLPIPHKVEVPPNIREWSAPSAFDERQLAEVLDWAGVVRPVEVATAAKPGFEVAIRRATNGTRVYVGVMRSWYGWYRDNIEKQDDLLKQFGLAAGTVTVRGLSAGTWQIRKFHRQAKILGNATVKEGILTFQTDPAAAAEVQLYELTKQGEG